MAKGDVVSAISAALASGGNLDYQPAAGVEAMITEVASDSIAADLKVSLYNGTTAALIHTHDSDLDETPFKILVNNTNYLRLTNSNAGAQDVAYCGIQTK